MNTEDNELTYFKVVALFSGIALYGILYAINDAAAAVLGLAILIAIFAGSAIAVFLSSAED